MLRASSPEMSFVGAAAFDGIGIGDRRTVRRGARKTLSFVMEVLQIFPLVGMPDDELARLPIRNRVFVTMLVKEVASS
jgi:hypothetical protein